MFLFRDAIFFFITDFTDFFPFRLEFHVIKSPFSFKRKPLVWFSLASGRDAASLWFVQTVGPMGRQRGGGEGVLPELTRGGASQPRAGAPGPVRRLPGASPEVDRGVQRLQQRQGLPEEPPGPAAPRAPAPAQRAHQADEGPGLWPGLQVQPRLQRASGAGVPAAGAAGRGLLQAAAVLTEAADRPGAGGGRPGPAFCASGGAFCGGGAATAAACVT